MNAGVVVVFAKAPDPGRVKTRLCPPLSPEQAADLYVCMLDDVLETTAAAAVALDLEAVLTVDPPEAREEMARRSHPAFRVVAQRGAGLAARMSHAVAECAAGGARRILLRGSDSPVLPASHLEKALRALDAVDLVACPDPDGGYSVLGLRRPIPGLFDHAMSHQRVLDQTLACARRAGLSSELLEPCFDLDTAEDLARLAECRARGGALPCRRTLAWLDRYRSWPIASS